MKVGYGFRLASKCLVCFPRVRLRKYMEVMLLSRNLYEDLSAEGPPQTAMCTWLLGAGRLGVGW